MAHLITPWQPQHPPNLHITHREGVWLTTHEGVRLWDACSQLMAVSMGHAHPRISTTLQAAIPQSGHLVPGLQCEWRQQLGEAMAPLLPDGFGPVLLTTGGADAIENAIKMARLATGRSIIITKNRSYHGATLGALSASGDPRRAGLMGLEAPGFVSVETADCRQCPWELTPTTCTQNCIDALHQLVNTVGPERVAGILLEGESGTSGCIPYPPGYWAAARALATHIGCCLIADEVMSGMGRCGEWFAVTGHGVTPDIIVAAKGLTNGTIPMGAVLIKHDLIYPRFEHDPLPLGLTYSAHPLGCAAAVATITAMTPVVHRAKTMAPWWLRTLHDHVGTHPMVGNIRSHGFLGCIELIDPHTRTPLVTRPHNSPWEQTVRTALLGAGIYPLVRWSHVFVAPPIIATESELIELARRLQTGLHTLYDTHFD